jgi:NUDIX domain
MYRSHIRAEIASIQPLDPLEATHQADALAWVDSDVELIRQIKPATPPKHLVSYFPVVSGSAILLVDHKNAKLWLPTGGHVEPNEHPRDTVSRELVEELGFSASHQIGPPLMVEALPPAKAMLADRGHDADWFRNALRARDHALHPVKDQPEDPDPPRQGTIQAASQDREHVRQVQGLAAHPYRLPQMRPHLLLSHRHRGCRHLLVVVNKS